MKERPIIFSTPMVQAILDERKSMTRRVLKRYPNEKATIFEESSAWPKQGTHVAKFRYPGDLERYEITDILKCPYGKTGDRLWVRETWAKVSVPDGTTARKIMTVFRASVCSDDKPANGWKPSIYMPRSISRILLEITNIHVQRLHDISESDAIKEGMRHDLSIIGGKFRMLDDNLTPRASFVNLWIHINGSWLNNPWVWVIEFKRI